MKKTILVLLLPWLLFGAENNFNSGANTAHAAAAFSLGAFDPGDSLTFNATSTFNDTIKQGTSINALSFDVAASYTGRIISQQTSADTNYISSTLNISIGTGGVFNPAAGVWKFTGNTKKWLWDGAGTFSNSTMCVVVDGTNDTLTDSKGVVFGCLEIKAAKSLINNGVVASQFRYLKIGNSAHFAEESAVTLLCDATGQPITLGTGYTWDGIGSCSHRANASSITVTVPAINYTGTGTMQFTENSLARTGVLFTLSGDMNLQTSGSFTFNNLFANSSMGLTSNGNNITCNQFRSGNSQSTGTQYISWVGGTLNCVTFRGDLNNGTGTSIDSLGDINCSGSVFTLGSNHTVVPGTSLITFNGSGAQVVTFNDKSVFDLEISNSGSDIATPVSFADSAPIQGDFDLTNGPFITSDGIYVAGSFTHTTPDSSNYKLVIVGDGYTRAAGANKNDTSGQHLIFNAGASHTAALANKVYARVTINGPTAISAATIATLSYGVDGMKTTITAGDTLTANSVTGMGGSSTSVRDSLLSDSDGDMTYFDLGDDTIEVSNFYAKDVTIINGLIKVIDGGLNGGNNVGIDWGAAKKWFFFFNRRGRRR